MSTTGEAGDPGVFLLFRSVQPGDGRNSAAALLAGVGAPVERVRSWCDEGQVYALCDLAGCADEPPAATVVTRAGVEQGTVEVCFVAVAPERRGLGLDRRMLDEVAHSLLAAGIRRLVVSAEVADAGTTGGLFERAGFRPDAGRGWYSREL
ncbi:MAG: GNAT family N-acetyltransferase [Acidimicrobiales bacterium]